MESTTPFSMLPELIRCLVTEHDIGDIPICIISLTIVPGMTRLLTTYCDKKNVVRSNSGVVTLTIILSDYIVIEYCY